MNADLITASRVAGCSLLCPLMIVALMGCKSLGADEAHTAEGVEEVSSMGSRAPNQEAIVPESAEAPPESATPASAFHERRSERRVMVEAQLASRDVTNARVLKAMGKVPRHAFIPREGQGAAYEDHPVRIGHRQTISQPYIVGYMTQALSPQPAHKILEIGTGSGYQAAVLAELVAAVYTIEIVEPLGARARVVLDELGYKNIHSRIGDGYAGWSEAAPFDGIMLTAAPPQIPQPLLDQLKIGGVMIAPVGRSIQELVRITRTADGFRRERVMGVRFVPMTGRAQEP